MIWWVLKLVLAVVLLNFFLEAAGWDPEAWTMPWLFQGTIIGIVACALIGPSEDY